MSNSSYESPSAYIHDVESLTIYDRLSVAAATLYYFEWLITLDQEYKFIWARKWTISTLVFAVNRYATFFDIAAKTFAAPSHMGCMWGVRGEATFELLQYLGLALFTALRAYAFSNRSVSLLVVVFMLSSVAFFSNLVIYVKEGIIYEPATSSTEAYCSVTYPFSAASSLIVSLVTRISMIVGDIIVLIATWRKTAGTIREAYRINVRVPLAQILVRDGTVFFMALLILNVFQILCENIPALYAVDPGSLFLAPLTSTIVSRFMFNLKQVAGESLVVPDGTQGDDHHGNTQTRTYWSTIRFNASAFMGLGNLGETIRLGDVDEELEDDNEDAEQNHRDSV